MTTRRLGIVMHGVTGRMGTNQHLVRSVLAIRKEGGVLLSDGSRVMPDPILIGRNAEKLGALARQYGVERWCTDLDKALDDDNLRKRLLDLGKKIPDKASRGQQELAALVKSEIARWTPIIKAANIKGE